MSVDILARSMTWVWRSRLKIQALGLMTVIHNCSMTRDKGQGTRDKGQGTRDKGQGTRDKGQGTRDKGIVFKTNDDAKSAMPQAQHIHSRLAFARASDLPAVSSSRWHPSHLLSPRLACALS